MNRNLKSSFEIKVGGNDMSRDRHVCVQSKAKADVKLSRIFETILLVDFSSFRIVLREIVHICLYSQAVLVRPQLIKVPQSLKLKKKST